MTEAAWGDDAKTPEIDWQMNAALENVLRGDEDLTEVTSLEGAVRGWSALDRKHREAAALTPERPLQIDGAAHVTFSGDGIATLVQWLPSANDQD